MAETLAEALKAEEAQLSLKVLGLSIRGRTLTFEEAQAVCKRAEEIAKQSQTD